MKKVLLIIIFSLIAVCLCACDNTINEYYNDLPKLDNQNVDVYAPSINVDLQGYAYNNLPKGQVDVKYDIFKATAFDSVDGNRDVNVSVNYKGSNKNIYDEGLNAFIPDKQGDYILTYTSTDNSQNTNSVKYIIEVKDNVDLPTISITNESVYDLDTGRSFDFITAKALGGSGNIDKRITVSLNEEVVKEFDGFEFKKYQFNKSGNYTVTYKVRDYLNRTEETSYKINVVDSDYPILNENIKIPKTMVSGSILDFSNFTAVDFSKDGLPKTTEDSIEVIYNGERKKYTKNDTITRESIGEYGSINQVVIKYEAKGKVGEIKQEFYVDVINGKNGDEYYLPALFNESSGIKLDKTSVLTYKIEDDNESIELAKETIAGGFKIGFIPSNIALMKFVVEDSVNEQYQVEISFAFSDTTTRIKLNGKNPVLSNISYGKQFLITYDKNNNAVYSNLNDGNDLLKLFKITEYSNGNQFSGFPSGKLKTKIIFETVKQDSTIRFTEIGNMNISTDNIIKDEVYPQVENVVFKKNRYNLNETAIIPSVMATDVLGNVESASVTVKAPDGQFVLKNVSAFEKHEIVLDSYGTYSITYLVSDDSDNPRKLNYGLYVVDTIAPKIVVKGDVKGKVKLNSTVELPSFEVTDNTFDEDGIYAYIVVITPIYHFEVVSKDDNGKYSYTFKETGEYTLRYYAEDYDGNYTKVEYKIKVEGD